MNNINENGTKEFENLKTMLKDTVEKHGDRTSHWKRNTETGAYVPSKTYNDFGHDIDCAGTAYINMGLKDKGIGIIGKNCCQWEEAYLAGTNGGAGYVVPLSTVLSEEQIVYLANTSKLEALLFTDEMKTRVLSASRNMPTVKYYIGLSDKDQDNGIIGFDEIIAKGMKLLTSGDRRFLDAEIDNKKMSLLLFTSGTSGNPKGVMHSHESVCSNVADAQRALKEHRYTEHDRIFSHLPASHIFGQTAAMLSRIEAGASVGFNEGGVRTFAKDLPAFDPTFLHGVPAHSNPVCKMLDAGFLKRLRLFIVGGAKPNPEIMKIIEENGIIALSGYGLTEYPIAMMNIPDDNKHDSSMGRAIGDVQYKIVDVEEEMLENPDIIKHGELHIKGKSLFFGYYEDEQATKEAFTEDGYFRTGDIVTEDADSFCDCRKRMGDRNKNGAGNWMDFLRIEAIADSNSYIAESIASVARFEDIPVTLVVRADMDKIRADFGEDISDERLLEIVDEQRKNINSQLPRYEQIGFVEIVHKPLARTVKGGLQRHNNLSERSKSFDKSVTSNKL